MYKLGMKAHLCTAAMGLMLLSACANESLDLLTPMDSARFSNNTPTLAWEKVKCDSYEVWLDGMRMVTLPSNISSYTVFPLSFGKHDWFVYAINGNDTIKSVNKHFVVDDAPLAEMPANSQLLRYDWHVCSSLQVGMDGKKLSESSIDTSDWASTSLPATVLTALVRNGIYPNPYVDMNNMLIPDMNDEYNQDYDLIKYSHIKGVNPWKAPYWYRTEFVCEEQLDKDALHQWLNLSEINYKAEVWLNGHLLADTTQVVGMERSFRFDVTSCLNKTGKNILAIAVYPPSPCGKPAPDPITPLGDPGCNMGDGMISKNYTKWDTMGWDWQPPVRDRDMGITEDVFITTTGTLELADLYVTSDLNLPDTLSADVALSADLINYSDKNQEGKLSVVITDGEKNISFEYPYEIKANSKKTFFWDKNVVEKLHIENPKLWWPFNYGEPHLYNVKITAQNNQGESTQVSEKFGIRKVETYLGEDERIYKINGRRIYPKGGNWVIDMMLNWNSSRYEKEILLTKNANLNILRVWGPTGVPPKALFRAADKYGVLMWQDFLNDFWGTFKNTPGYQPEIGLFEKATIDVVKKYRNHPSLIIWCGGNEGVNPREKLITQQILPEYDGRGTRHYLKQSDGDGLHGGGPYHTLEPKEYFVHPKLHGFSSEIGPSGVPVYESVCKFMPNVGENWLAGRFPLDKVWAFHDANDWPGTDTRKFSSYDNIVRTYYGISDTIDTQKGVQEYLDKAQLVNYDVYRASIEAINRLLWTKGSGILLWKSNSSWPSLTWQVYDWYLQAHAGYYGTKKAASNVHVQWNRDNNSISVINMSGDELNDVEVCMQAYDVSGKMLKTASEKFSLGVDSVSTIGMKVEVPVNAEFLKLSINAIDNRTLADNFYWVSQNNDFRCFANIAQPKLMVKILEKKDLSEQLEYEVKVSNEGESLAYMLSLRMVGKDSGLELLPALWTDNYIILLPGESRVLKVKMFKEDMVELPKLVYTTYAGQEQELQIVE